MKYFELREFTCKCCGRLPDEQRQNVEALVENVLDPAREAYGGPIYVNSGYRCERHNAEVGGVKRSQHLVGQAADIRCADNKKLEQILTDMGCYDQLIIYPTFIHVSWRRNGKNRKMKFYRK